jgi:hypothetical protein
VQQVLRALWVPLAFKGWMGLRVQRVRKELQVLKGHLVPQALKVRMVLLVPRVRRVLPVSRVLWDQPAPKAWTVRRAQRVLWEPRVRKDRLEIKGLQARQVLKGHLVPQALKEYRVLRV